MEEHLEKLRASGRKVTPRRKAIIRLFLQEQGDLSPQDVQEALSGTTGQFGLPGIYRNLDILTTCGILFRVVTYGGERRYALCKAGKGEGHHHHIVCIACRKVGKVSDCLYKDGMMVEGFRLVSHVVQLNGLCESCAKEKNDLSALQELR